MKRDGRRQAIGKRGTPEEDYADAFAAALLMPEDLFREAWREKVETLGGSPVLLIPLFGVPAEAVIYRARMLGLMPEVSA